MTRGINDDENVNILNKPATDVGAVARSQLIPLRRENQRLLRQNNALHLHLVQQSEDTDKKTRDWEQRLHKLEGAQADLKFLYGQKSRQVKTQEGTITELRSRLEDALRGKDVFSKESREIVHNVDAQSSMEAQNAQLPTPHSQSVVDLCQISAQRIEVLSHQLRQYQEKEAQFRAKAEKSEYNESLLQTEIARLGRCLEQERNWDKLQGESEIGRVKKIIVKLNTQIDYLNNKRVDQKERLEAFETRGVNQSVITEHETEVTELTTELAAVKQKYAQSLQISDGLRDDLKVIRNQAMERTDGFATYRRKMESELESKQLQFESLRDQYEQVLHDLDETNNEVKYLQSKPVLAPETNISNDSLMSDLSEKETELQLMVTKYNQTLQDFEELKRDTQSLRTDLALIRDRSHAENEKLRGALKKEQENNERLMERYKTISNSRAGLEVDRLHFINKVEEMDSVQQRIQTERDYFKTEMDTLLVKLQEREQRAVDSESSGEALSLQLTQTQNELEAAQMERNRLLEELSNSDIQAQNFSKQDTDAQTEILRLHAMLDGLRNVQATATEHLKQSQNKDVERRQAEREAQKLQHKLNLMETEKKESDAIKIQLSADNTSMRQTISQFDAQVTQIYAEISALANERDTLQDMYQQVLSELSSRMDQIKELEDTKRQYEDKEHELKSENAQLKSGLENMNESVGKEGEQTRRAQQQLRVFHKEREALERQLQVAINERTMAREETETTKKQLNTFKLQVEGSEADKAGLLGNLDASESMIAHLKAQIEELKSLCRQVDQTRARSLEQLQEYERHLNTADNRTMELEQEIQQLRDQNTAGVQEQQTMKQVIDNLEGERTHLQASIDQQSTFTRQLEHDNQHGRIKREELESVAETARLQLEAHTEELSKRDTEVKNLYEQLSLVSHNYQRLEEQHNLKSRELKAVLEDLGNMIKENQFVNKELSDTVGQRDRRTKELESILTRLAYVEEVSAVKNQERSEIMMNYKAACQENERLKIAAEELDFERSKFQNGLAQGQENINHLQVVVQELQQERDNAFLDLQAFEKQNEMLSRRIETLSLAFEACQAEKNRSAKDTMIARDMAVGLEAKRKELHQIVVDNQREIASLKATIHQLGTENKAVGSNLAHENDKSLRLQSLVADARVQMQRSETEAHGVLQEQGDQMRLKEAQLKQLKEQVDSDARQIQQLHGYREKQAAEIRRLLQTLADQATNLAAADGSGLSEATEKERMISTLAAKVNELQMNLDQQFTAIRMSNDEKSKLRAIVFKYEAELVKQERKIDRLKHKLRLYRQKITDGHVGNLSDEISDENVDNGSHA